MKFTLLPLPAIAVAASPTAVVLLDTTVTNCFELRTAPPGSAVLEAPSACA
jgi:hypothetical protein